MLAGDKRKRLFALMLAGLIAGCSEQGSDHTLIMPLLELDQEIAVDLAEVFRHNSKHSITLVPLPDRFATPLDAIEAGYADLAFAANAQAYRKGVTTVMPVYPTVLHVLYQHKLDIDHPRALLQDASVYAGAPGSSSRLALESILQGLGLGVEDVNFSDEPDALPDVIVLYFPLSPAFVEARLREFGAENLYRIASFGAPEEIGTGSDIDRAVLLNPRLSTFIIPKGTYGDMQPNAVVTMAVDKLLVARPDLPDTEVYDLINEIHRLQPALAATRPLVFTHLGEDFEASGSTFVLHSGSQAFTRRDEPDVYERYSGVAEVLVTLVIGLISGTYAIVQIYNRRRKNRIDVFYTRAIAIRDAIIADSSGSERAAAIEEGRKLQNSAFEMLVDEKVAADDSFRIFITLSNDILTELGARRGPTSV
jgi:TRAP-type uncharacterized transport system substrate-binding protein